MIDDLKVLILGHHLHFLEVGGTRIQHDVGVEIKHLFQIGHGHVEQGSDLGRQGLQKPDMRHRRGEFDMPHALAAHLGGDDFHAAFFADDAAMLHALVFAAVAFVIFHRAEDLGAEKAVALRLERAVIDGLRLLHLAVGPFTDVFRRGDGNLNGLQIADLRRVRRGRRAPHGEQFIKTHVCAPFANRVAELPPRGGGSRVPELCSGTEQDQRLSRRACPAGPCAVRPDTPGSTG